MELVFIDNNVFYNYKIEYNKKKIEKFKDTLIGASRVEIENISANENSNNNNNINADIILSNIQWCDGYTNVIYNEKDNSFTAAITTYPVLYHVLFGRYKSYNKPLESVYLWLTNTIGIKESEDTLYASDYLAYLKTINKEDDYAYDIQISETKKIWFCRMLFQALDIKLIKAIAIEEFRDKVDSLKKTCNNLPVSHNLNDFLKSLEKQFEEANKNGEMFHEIANKLNIYINEEGKMAIESTMVNPLLEKKTGK